MPNFWTRMVDSLPRDSKSLVWRVPLVFFTILFFLFVFFPYRDTPYATWVVRDTYVEGKLDPDLREIVSTQTTNRWVWLTSFFHYKTERELASSPLPPVAGREVRERTLEIRSRGLNLGLDLRGGTELLYRIVQVGGGESVNSEEIKKVIEKRINIHGLREPRIQAQGTHRILVQLPGQEVGELDRLKNIIQNIGHLEFRIVASTKSTPYKQWQDTGTAPPGYTEYTIKAHANEEGSHEEKALVSDKQDMTGEKIASTRVIPPGAGGTLRGFSVGLSFTPAGEQEFARVTGDNIGERLAIILNTVRDAELNIAKDDKGVLQKGVCDSAPVIKTRIFGDAVIEGNFNDKAAQDLRTVLMAGSLPAPLQLEHETTVGPGLGSAMISKGIRASVIGTLLVVLFMAAYYLVAGLIADFAVVLNVLILVSIMILFGATLTLPGIAGLALTVGMAVDANVLIFERIREELSGPTEKPLRLAVREGFGRAFWTIFDSNLTTILTAIILYWIGTGPIKGFGLTLTIGLMINIFSAVVVTRVIFDVAIWRRWLTRLPMLQFFKRPNIPFMSLRYKAFAGSAILIVLGMTVFFWRGNDNWDIDFRGGTLLHVAFRQPMEAEDITRRIQSAGPEFAGCEVQSLAPAAQEGGALIGRRSREFEVRIPSLSEVTIRPPTTDPTMPPGTLKATATLRTPMAAADLSQKLEPYGYTAQPVGEAKDGKHSQFVITAQAIDAKQVEADVEKALESAKPAAEASLLASFQPGPITLNYPTTIEAEFDRPAPIAEVQKQLNASGDHWQVKPDGPEKSPGEYQKFTILSSVRDTNTARSQVERAFTALSLSAEITRLFKDELAPPGIEIRTQDPARTSLALNLTRPVELGTLRARLTTWNIDATAHVEPEGAGADAERFLITLPAAKVPELSARLNEDAETFRLSDPIPRVAKVGPAVARELLTWALIGVFASWLAIIAYVWLRFERIKYGVAGVVALVHDVLITIGFMAVCGRKFNISVVAAILTIIGYSINDTIVVFDRIRENLRKERRRDVDGDLIDRSVNQTISRTVLTSLTTLFAVAALFLFAGGVIQDFALALLIGIVTGTYSSVFIASPILILHQEQVEKRFARAKAATA